MRLRLKGCIEPVGYPLDRANLMLTYVKSGIHQLAGLAEGLTGDSNNAIILTKTTW